MEKKAQILCYHLPWDERTRKLRRYLNKAHIQLRMVEPAEFLHPLGFLFEIPGFGPSPQFNLGQNFSEEMLVMKDFSNEQLDAFLAFFREEGLAPVTLKAILTPVNQHWNSLRLYEELKKENSSFKGKNGA